MAWPMVTLLPENPPSLLELQVSLTLTSVGFYPPVESGARPESGHTREMGSRASLSRRFTLFFVEQTRRRA